VVKGWIRQEGVMLFYFLAVPVGLFAHHVCTHSQEDLLLLLLVTLAKPDVEEKYFSEDVACVWATRSSRPCTGVKASDDARPVAVPGIVDAAPAHTYTHITPHTIDEQRR
jgi:hypothetical protein